MTESTRKGYPGSTFVTDKEKEKEQKDAAVLCRTIMDQRK